MKKQNKKVNAKINGILLGIFFLMCSSYSMNVDQKETIGLYFPSSVFGSLQLPNVTTDKTGRLTYNGTCDIEKEQELDNYIYSIKVSQRKNVPTNIYTLIRKCVEHVHQLSYCEGYNAARINLNIIQRNPIKAAVLGSLGSVAFGAGLVGFIWWLKSGR